MSSRKGFGLIGILITILIIALLSGIMMKFYFGNTTPAQSVQQGIDAINAAQGARNSVDQYNQKMLDQLKESR